MTRLPRTAALAATAIGLTALITGCSSSTSASGGDGGGEADCAWTLSYGSRTYQRPWPATISVRDSVHHQGKALGVGTLKGCSDGGTDNEESASVYRIKGVPPEQAIISEDDVIGLTDPHHIPEAVRILLNMPSSPSA
ncbi:DUF6281 family protein [Streptomyces sp. NBC_00820]|uniref:DUF6281 family protein n=1 Tax=Streptomyces sp. NBC_00820 TaxID=2975842 RepID=UPI002ED1A2E1|nr:DUF6281 family protein [Streptomyces sp. NBC_00820]